ncbi:hypothetical protein PR202_gb25568 [Eleusine coracana subsp. coracana]|uniref:Uncharacterized protein n=1 Tax=Eleusine coracana subsp. coracana TaxID=191504 RepID=A0AAV5FQC1_ELECO|nr:hypothetical protein PR202_gb25568 [Eleusine coracana subsp. coracana]
MPIPTTVSTSTPVAEQGKHVFHITGFSKHMGMGDHDDDGFIRSGNFKVGGYDWAIRLYPDGSFKQWKEYISVYLELMSINVKKVRAAYDLRLVDHSTGLSSSVHKAEPRMFNSRDGSRFAPQTPLFMKRNELESGGYLRDHRLTIVCIVQVFKEPQVSECELRPKIKVPPSDILQHLGRLLETGEAADVTFSVAEQTFPAHRTILIMRSPVFMAELCGPMCEAKTQHVIIKGMQPAVFRALLHFIYTDSLPMMDELSADDRSEMIRHLLVAADRYAVDRLKLMCESILCEELDMQNVAVVLALADQHQCNMLKDACLEFMSSSMDDVVSTAGYVELQRNCPSVLVDALVKMIQWFK